ncbi:ferritin-like domain-containing protein [Gluconacetobacter sp. Hr-1-5]|uniref:YciE/YciF ferroxidase family protein n=1 Tax=Gluconacetobacter sp. Hr-1-5 TaxID=3395370 RepID=UPI003B52AAAF
MATQKKTLSDAFYETLKDIYFAEKQILKALKRSVRAAQAPDLKKAFETHATETAHHVERLNEVFGLIGKAPRSKTCEATQGILAEMEEDLETFGTTEAADAVLIGCAQSIEHYEISRYGTLKAWAATLGLTEAEELLAETLEEEKRTDALLTEIAERESNPEAALQPT